MAPSRKLKCSQFFRRTLALVFKLYHTDSSGTRALWQNHTRKMQILLPKWYQLNRQERYQCVFVYSMYCISGVYRLWLPQDKMVNCFKLKRDCHTSVGKSVTDIACMNLYRISFYSYFQFLVVHLVQVVQAPLFWRYLCLQCKINMEDYSVKSQQESSNYMFLRCSKSHTTETFWSEVPK